MKIVRFMDMHSGGGQKEKYSVILIEAMGEAAAKIIFYNRFGHNPERVTCTCCGDDYSINECDDLLQATAFDRGCNYNETLRLYEEKQDQESSWRTYKPLSEYLKEEDVLFICDDDVKSEERYGEIPQQGYVWVD